VEQVFKSEKEEDFLELAARHLTKKYRFLFSLMIK
jgi:hypothetical protein